MSPSGTERGARPRETVTRPVLLGVAALAVALLLQVGHGLVLMGYEDQGGGEWSHAGERAWLTSLTAGWRALYWITAIGAPVALLLGVALVAVALRRMVAARRERPSQGR